MRILVVFPFFFFGGGGGGAGGREIEIKLPRREFGSKIYTYLDKTS